MSVVFAVTGIRGVGKTQVAAAYARRRIAEGWRLVAWVDASDEASVLAGLAQVAVAAGLGFAGDDSRVLAAAVRHWLEADGERRLLVFNNAVDLDVLRPFVPADSSPFCAKANSGGRAYPEHGSCTTIGAGSTLPSPLSVLRDQIAIPLITGPSPGR